MLRKMFIVLFVVAFSTLLYAQEEARILRFPAIHGDNIVFSSGGDLYTVSSNGGIARKLTNQVGMEIFARFSPDGQHIAFTGQYDGNSEVYLMPAEGGIPKRITYTATLGRDDVSDRMGPNNLVMGWRNDGENIIFRSRMREWNAFNGQLYIVNKNGEMPEQLPFPRGGFCSYSPDNKKLVYNRIFREFRTWKRYKGGMADDIWIYDFASKEIENITNNDFQDIIPMWYKTKIFYISDREKIMNLFEYDLKTKKTRKVTNFKKYDIKYPSLGKDHIVFENEGYVYKYDIEADKYTKVKIFILNDKLGTRGGITDVSKNISNYGIAPDGKRAVFGARGDVFTVPAKDGNIRNLTNSPGVHERNSVWSPDGKYIAYVSDRSGEDQIYITPQDGNGKEIQVTKNNETYIFGLNWSPDAKMIIWTDQMQRLRYVNIETKKIVNVLSLTIGNPGGGAWSPDNKWLTYSRPEKEGMNKVYLYNLESKKHFPVTEGWYGSGSSVFSSDGKYLFFVSSRTFRPTYSRVEWNYAYRNMSKIYLVTLAKDTDSPFKPQSDEVAVKKDDKKEEKPADKKKDEKNKKSADVKVDIDGIQNRILELPVAAGNYGGLVSVKSSLYYFGAGGLKMFDLKSKKETTLGNVRGYDVSADKKKMLVRIGSDFGIINLPKAKIKIKDKMDISGLSVGLDREKEWAQIYKESWRQMREFFYDKNMHGNDWESIYDKYKPLVKHVAHRTDLTYILGEMVSELNCGHCYVGGGDYPKAVRIQTGLLGAEIEKDRSGYFRIKRILKGQNWNNDLKSPLAAIGVDAKEGDLIIAINGKSTKEQKNIFSELVNTVGKQVTLKLNSKASEKGSREVVIVPIASESRLYYYNWVERNIEKVNKATNGKVGYIHVPDMGVNGLNEFVKHYYPQLRKKALIIDVRGNGGGNVSPMLIERLRREIAWAAMRRNTDPNPNPGGMLLGPKVCLLDQFSASDGDLFPYRFKKHKLGKLIGKRSWGGVVGYSGQLPLLDGGTVIKPQFAPYDDEGKGWIIEGKGVEPDIEIDNDPAKEFAGIDEQLNKAIEVILEELKTKGKTISPIPKGADKR